MVTSFCIGVPASAHPFLKNPKKEKAYYEAFFVGLMDGDGSIQVNHWRQKVFQYRMVIKLKNTTANVQMLQQLKVYLGIGHVVVSKNKAFVLWIEKSQKKMVCILALFEKYPPMTTRLNLQLVFFKKWLQSPEDKKQITEYLTGREYKYKERPALMQTLSSVSLETLDYFPGWFSGFVEAEGCFSLRRKSTGFVSFSIGQRHDDYLLWAIHRFLGAQNKVRYLPSTNFYVLEVYRKSVLCFLKTHFIHYPLLGEKKLHFETFEKKI
uniref:Homing endonuclease LAGLIDADG domain-containing protein n=1 Tax=Ankistrodesmus falcatus TaxID=52960 RepID=A0A7L7K6E9_9CHLO|nr:hypothetical protein [Ankistrodesmus falcatus]QMS48907.1 hypothetical protein [Ankistrodesmus falcatus]